MLNKVREDSAYEEKYEYIVIEMIDQMTRMESGGEMLQYWQKETCDENYVKYRTGFPAEYNERPTIVGVQKWKMKVKNMFRAIMQKTYWGQVILQGRFALSGEQHKWMYDSYSLKKILSENGFKNISIMIYNQSKIKNWENYKLEINENGEEYKPNCLYIEGVK